MRKKHGNQTSGSEKRCFESSNAIYIYVFCSVGYVVFIVHLRMYPVIRVILDRHGLFACWPVPTWSGMNPAVARKLSTLSHLPIRYAWTDPHLIHTQFTGSHSIQRSAHYAIAGLYSTHWSVPLAISHWVIQYALIYTSCIHWSIQYALIYT